MKAWRLLNAKLTAKIKATSDPEEKQKFEQQKLTRRQARTHYAKIDKIPSPLLCNLFVKIGLMETP